MTSSFQNVVGTPRDQVPDISKTNYLNTEADMTESVNAQINDNIKDTKQFFDQMVELEELAASKLDKRLAAIESIIGTVGQIKKKRDAEEADGFGRIVNEAIENKIIEGSKEYQESKNQLDLDIASANAEIDEDPNLNQQTKNEYKFGTPTEEIFDRRIKDFIQERYVNKAPAFGDLLRSNGSLDSTTAQEHLEYEQKATLSFFRNIGYDAKQLGYDPTDPRFIKQTIKLLAPLIKAQAKAQRETFKITFRDKVQDEENYTFNTRLIESVKGISVRNADGERTNDTIFKDGGVIHQISIQKRINRQRATDLAFETIAELVKSGDILPNEARAIYQDLPYTDPNGKKYKNYEEYVNKQTEGTGFKARALGRIRRLSNAITGVEKLAVENENAARVIEANNFVNNQVIKRIAENKARGIDGLEDGQAGALINQYKQESFYLEGVTPIPQILLSYQNRTQTGGSRNKNVLAADKYASKHNETDKLIDKLVARKETESGDTGNLTDLDIRVAEAIKADFREKFIGPDGRNLDLFELAEGRGTLTYENRRDEILAELEKNYKDYVDDSTKIKKLTDAGVGDVIALRRQLTKNPELFKKQEAFKSEPVDKLFDFVDSGGARHPELKQYYKALRIRVTDENGNIKVLSGTEAIYDRAEILGLIDSKTLRVDPHAKILKDFRKENDMKTFPSEQKAFRNMRTGEQQDFNEYLTMLSEKRGGQNANQFEFNRNGNTSVRQNLNSLDGGQVVDLANNGSDNFGMYNLSTDMILDLDRLGLIDKTKPFNEDAQSFAVVSLMAMKANRKSNAIRGAITNDTKDFGKLIKLTKEEQDVVNTVFPNLTQNYFAQFQNLEAEVAKIIISDIEKERLAKKGKRGQQRAEDQLKRDTGTFRRGR